MALFPQIGVPSCAACQTRMFEHQCPSQIVIAFWVSHRLPEGRLEVDIANSAQFSAPYCYSTVTGIDGDRGLRYLSATVPRAGKSASDLMN